MELFQIVDLKPECFEEYRSAHESVPVESELQEVGLHKIRVLHWTPLDNSSPIRLVMTGLWSATMDGETFEQAMERYMSLPGVAQWEAWMDKLKVPLPGCAGPNWQICSELYRTPGS